MNFLIFLALIITAYLSGRYVEKRHFADIAKREDLYRHIPLIANQWKQTFTDDCEGQVFGGGVVIGADYFKSVVSGLRGLFGGNMKNYENLLDRGRREALLRLQEKAERWGAEKIVNVRVETAVIGSQSGKQALPCVEIYAYGTAVKKRQNETHSKENSRRN